MHARSTTVPCKYSLMNEKSLFFLHSSRRLYQKMKTTFNVGLKGTVVIRTGNSLNARSLKDTSTVPYRESFVENSILQTVWKENGREAPSKPCILKTVTLHACYILQELITSFNFFFFWKFLFKLFLITLPVRRSKGSVTGFAGVDKFSKHGKH